MSNPDATTVTAVLEAEEENDLMQDSQLKDDLMMLANKMDPAPSQPEAEDEEFVAMPMRLTQSITVMFQFSNGNPDSGLFGQTPVNFASPMSAGAIKKRPNAVIGSLRALLDAALPILSEFNERISAGTFIGKKSTLYQALKNSVDKTAQELTGLVENFNDFSSAPSVAFDIQENPNNDTDTHVEWQFVAPVNTISACLSQLSTWIGRQTEAGLTIPVKGGIIIPQDMMATSRGGLELISELSALLEGVAVEFQIVNSGDQPSLCWITQFDELPGAATAEDDE